MRSTPTETTLPALRGQIRRIEAFERPAVALGVPALDRHLPQAGLALGALHEVAPTDFRAGPAAQGFLLALCASLAKAREGPVLWPSRRVDDLDFGAPYAPGLAQIGIAPMAVAPGC